MRNIEESLVSNFNTKNLKRYFYYQPHDFPLAKIFIARHPHTHTHQVVFMFAGKKLPKYNPGTLTAGTQQWKFPEDDFPDVNWGIFRLTVRYLSGVYHVGMLKVKTGSQGPVFIGKMVVPLGWRAPSCLIPPVGALQKEIYPINIHVI